MRWCDLCHRPWSLAYCGQHPHTRQPGPARHTLAYVPCAAPATLDRVYCVLLAALPLAPSHRQTLRQRGLADAEMLRRQYRTFPLQGRAALAKHLVEQLGVDLCAQVPGFYLATYEGRCWWSLAGAAGLLIPVRSLDGHIVALKVRADAPGEGAKYTTISSAKHGGPSPGAQVHVPRHDGLRGETIRLTEGELKADVATVLSGVLTISVPGVAMWRKVLPVLKALQPQRVLVAFDADWRTNPHVAQALGQAVAALVGAGYTIEVESWPPALGKGIDDVLAAGRTPTVQSAVPWLHRARTFPEKSGGRPSHIVVEVR
jgi:DNA primase